MPSVVKLTFNPAFKPENEAEKSALSIAKKAGAFDTYESNAEEAIRNSRGLYMLVADERAPVPQQVRQVEDMTKEELVSMMASLGIQIEPKMKKADVITAIRAKMEAVELSDD